jgi:DNA-binding transcriptional LysR family regulator
VPRIALELVLWDVIPAFREAFPEIELDLDVNDASGGTYSVEAPGSLTVNDHLSMLDLAGRGVGLAHTLDLLAGGAICERRLEEVLTPHMPKASDLFLYFPAKSQTQPKLRAFIDFAKERTRRQRRR